MRTEADEPDLQAGRCPRCKVYARPAGSNQRPTIFHEADCEWNRKGPKNSRSEAERRMPKFDHQNAKNHEAVQAAKRQLDALGKLDRENDHLEGDFILLELLRTLGFGDVSDAYDAASQRGKWVHA